MATVIMPQLGESVTEGTILQWLKQPGEAVQLDDPLCEIETEKVTAELPSPFEGTMGAIHVPEGETVEVGAALCDVVEAGVSSVPAEPRVQPAAHAPPENGDDDDLPLPRGNGWSGGPMAIPKEDQTWAEPTPLTEDGPPPKQRVVAVPAAAPARATPATGDRASFYSPAVLRLAHEHGLDLASIPGSGDGGRVTKRDVEAAVASGGTAKREPPEAALAGPVAQPVQQPPAPADEPRRSEGTPVALSATRRTIAARLTKSNLEAPQAWTMAEADVTALVRRREQERTQFERLGIKLTLFPYFVEAVCMALREVPELNARWEGDQLVRYEALNLGVAVAAPHGLVVPVLRDAGSLSTEGLARAIEDLADRARARKLRVEDIEGGTFTVNNTGSFGSIASKPIVNHPEVGIVTFERAVQRPVVANDAIAIRWMANVCLSFDHRALDGLEAGRFLAALKEALEAPA
jgi:2-oxoisovalerate dehydrogenase E2 component (dihydrolipoyl transacylase)